MPGELSSDVATDGLSAAAGAAAAGATAAAMSRTATDAAVSDQI